MKSKKIVALIVAFAAFMAIATSGLAAVTTTTTYDRDAEKAIVDVTITGATEKSEVTYLVKSGSNIVYIDQYTADATGSVGFRYKVSKANLNNLATVVTIGTDGAPIEDAEGGKTINLGEITATLGENVTSIKFYADADKTILINEENPIVGDEFDVWAVVTFADGYEVDTVIGGDSNSSTFKVTDKVVNVTAKRSIVAPSVSDDLDLTITGTDLEDTADEETKTVTKIFKVTGDASEVGIIYNGENFPAYSSFDGENGVKLTSGLYAVRLIVDADTVIDDAAIEGYALPVSAN